MTEQGADTSDLAQELRAFSLPHQRVGGYSRAAVERLLGRAAQTVEALLEEARAAQDEIARLRSSQAAHEERLAVASRRSAKKIVGDVLMTAHRAADGVIEKARRNTAQEAATARRETMPIPASAQRTLEEARRLHREAQATVAEARLKADDLLRSARAEGELIIADSTGEAERRRAELELDCARFETAIKSLRSEWVGRVAEALARLNGMTLGSGSAPDSAEEASTSNVAPDAGKDHEGDFHEDDSVHDLRARLPERGVGMGSHASDRVI